MNGSMFPNVMQSLLVAAVLGCTTYLASVNQLAPELVGGVFVLALQSIFQERKRNGEAMHATAVAKQPATAQDAPRAEAAP